MLARRRRCVRSSQVLPRPTTYQSVSVTLSGHLDHIQRVFCLACDEYYRQTDWPKGDTLDSPIAGVTSADECCSKCEDKGVDGPSVPAVHLDIHVPLNCPECKAFVFLEPDGGCWHKRQLKDPEHCPSCSSKNFLEEVISFLTREQ